jgi:hypothetical protein
VVVSGEEDGKRAADRRSPNASSSAADACGRPALDYIPTRLYATSSLTHHERLLPTFG